MIDSPEELARLGIPTELVAQLPIWWRLTRHTVQVLAVIGLVIMFFIERKLGYGFLPTVLYLVSAPLLDLISLRWLMKEGKIPRGTWLAEWLPGVVRLRAAFVVCFGLAGVCAYLVLERGVHSFLLILITFALLTMLPLLYVCLSVKQGFIGRGVAINFRSREPIRFWAGLATYTTAFVVLIFVVSFALWMRYQDLSRGGL